MDCIVQGVAESQTGLSDFHFHFSRLKVLRSIGLRINIPSLERVEKCIHFLFVFLKITQSCPTLCVAMDYKVRGILQARILEWVAFPFFRGSSQPRN